MARIPSFAIICFVSLVPAAIAQQPAQVPQAQAPQVPPVAVVPPPAPAQEGFFRPSADPALTSFPSLTQPVEQPAPEAAALAQQRMEREALEQELDRSRREAARAQAEAAQRPAPMIVSPLDGTAPIVSPLGR